MGGMQTLGLGMTNYIASLMLGGRKQATGCGYSPPPAGEPLSRWRDLLNKRISLSNNFIKSYSSLRRERTALVFTAAIMHGICPAALAAGLFAGTHVTKCAKTRGSKPCPTPRDRVLGERVRVVAK